MCKDNREIMVVSYTGCGNADQYRGIYGFCALFPDRAEIYISPTVKISEWAIIEGKVIIEDNVLIMEILSLKARSHQKGRQTISAN